MPDLKTGKRKERMRKTIRFIDMFAGIGGFREGFGRAGGFECVGYCERDQYALRSYCTCSTESVIKCFFTIILPIRAPRKAEMTTLTNRTGEPQDCSTSAA